MPSKPMLTNYHTHSTYCDGKGTPRQMVEFALTHGFSHLGFSGHAPLPFSNTFSIKTDQYQEYCRTIRQLKAEYEGRIEIKLGLEIDYVPSLLDNFAPLISGGGLDYTIGSVHLVPAPSSLQELREHPSAAAQHLWMIDGPNYQLYDQGLQLHFGGDIRRAVKAFFHQTNLMITTQRPTIVGHFDKVVMHNRDRYFHYDEPWFRDLLCETVQLIKECNCLCEINTRGIYRGRHNDFYPGRDTIRYMNSLRIPVIVSTDAHAPDDLIRTEGCKEFLRSIGYSNVVEVL